MGTVSQQTVLNTFLPGVFLDLREQMSASNGVVNLPGRWQQWGGGCLATPAWWP